MINSVIGLLSGFLRGESLFNDNHYNFLKCDCCITCFIFRESLRTVAIGRLAVIGQLAVIGHL